MTATVRAMPGKAGHPAVLLKAPAVQAVPIPGSASYPATITAGLAAVLTVRSINAARAGAQTRQGLAATVTGTVR